MKVVFTICSNNYLAQAKVLGDSIRRHNPEYDFFIGLCDRKSDLIDYQNEIAHTIIPVEEIGIPKFDTLWKKYEIVELNTCVKPFYFDYFVRKYDNIEYIHYLDPDTYFFDDIKLIEDEFCGSSILLTPHITSAIDLDDNYPKENLFLNYGIYNLGYLGMKNPHESLDLIDWWKERTYKLGYNRPIEGLFVDQLWFNLVPLFFSKVKVSFHLGLNMAPWNLHDRYLSRHKSDYKVNNRYQLVFYHFSNYNYKSPELLTSSYNRFSFENRPDLKDIYREYLSKIKEIDIPRFSQLSCYFMQERANYLFQIELDKLRKQRTISWWIKRLFRNVLPPIVTKALNKIFSSKIL